MQISIKNFRGIKSADIDASKIALVAGPNGAGKSSVALAAAAALTGQAVPIDGVPKSMAGALIRDGGGKSGCSVTGPAGAVGIGYPEGKPKSTDTPPSCSKYAAGLASFCDAPIKDRAEIIRNYLTAADPTRDDLARAVGIDDAKIDRMWARLLEIGWDAAWQQCKDVTTGLKSSWAEIAGEQYGPSKAEAWVPDNWDSSLENESEQSLHAAVATARELLESVIAVSAVSDAERQELERQADLAKQLRQNLAGHKVRKLALDAEIEQAEKMRDELPLPSSMNKSHPCPHCGALVVITKDSLAASDYVDIDDDRARGVALKKINERIHDMCSTRGEIEQRIRETDSAIRQSDGAAQKLAGLPKTSTATGDINAARSAVSVAEARLAAFAAHKKASATHEAIKKNQIIIAAMAPDGVRLQCLLRSLSTLNAALAEHCGIAGWPAIEIEPELTVSYGGRPYPLCSKSEQFRCRVILQMYMAARDKSSMLIIDAADILDKPGRNGLMRLLLSAGLPALVCMTEDAPDNVPDLDAKNLGRSYWIADAEAIALAVARGG